VDPALPPTEPRTWCGTAIPDDVATVPHPTALRLVFPAPRFVLVFRAVFCVLGLAMVAAQLVVDPRGAWPLAVPVLLAVALVATRPPRTTITFRPGSSWVTIASVASWAARPYPPDAVGLEVEHAADGWVARLVLRRLSEITLATTEPFADRDAAVAHLLPLADTLRREMGGAPLPPP